VRAPAPAAPCDADSAPWRSGSTVGSRRVISREIRNSLRCRVVRASWEGSNSTMLATGCNTKPDENGAPRSAGRSFNALKVRPVTYVSLSHRGYRIKLSSPHRGAYIRCATSAARPARHWPWHLRAPSCSRLPPGPCTPFAQCRSAIRRSPGPLCGCHRLLRRPHCRFGVPRRC
jgi:hypothetical protein